MGKTEIISIDIDYLCQRLRYEPETGKLYWLDYEGMPNNWRARFSGKEAFTAVDSKGYKHGKLDGSLFRGHRVIWALHHGEWPIEQIDHVNGVRTDNRVSNLRAVSNRENQRNSKMSSRNTSGVCGVYWHKSLSKWVARINTSGKREFLGHFDIIEEATKVRKEAEVKYSYHENHGRH